MMKRSVYKSVVKVIETEEWDFDSCQKVLIDYFPEENPKSLRSILAQEYAKRCKKTHGIQTSSARVADILRKYKAKTNSKDYKPGQDEGVVVGIAKKNRFSPNLTARIILEHTLGGAEPNSNKVNSELNPRLSHFPLTFLMFYWAKVVFYAFH